MERPSGTDMGPAEPESEVAGLSRPSRRREAATTIRIHAAEQHVREGARRDELARARDAAAEIRDRAAVSRDRRMAVGVKRRLAFSGRSVERVLATVEALRIEAEADRACAAEDRRLAAEDRARAAEEGAEALDALRGAHVDELTGAHRRGFGEELLAAEIQRARRDDRSLVLAIVDVDGLKEVNDREGHLAGDQLLRDVVAAIRSQIRSYEPVVRLGGDEFAFAIGQIDRAGGIERCGRIRADLARRPSAGSFRAGIAELRPGDGLRELMRRADADLLEARDGQRRTRFVSHSSGVA
jgi:diguanylate cyclase (GGDEF)-like protein